MMKIFSRSKYAVLISMLLVGVLVLSACGSDEPDPAVEDTQDVVEEEPTPEPVEEVVEEAEEEAEAAEGEAEVSTDTEVMTDTATITETEMVSVVTTTELMTETIVMTETRVISETDVMTETEGVVDTEVTTGTGEIEGSEVMTDTEGNVEDSSDELRVSPMRTTGVSDATGQLVYATSLTGADFVNQDGGVSGNVEDFLVDVSTGNILFGLIEYGGFLDIGDTNLVMPMSAFQWGNDQLILNFDEQELTNFPGVDENWPNLEDPAWDDDVTGFWRDIGIDFDLDFNETNSANVMWLSDMTSFGLMDIGDGPGTIQDVLVDLENSRIKYILFDYGIGAVGDDAYIIPYSALDIQNMGENEIAFDANIDQAMLQEAPRFDRALYPAGETLTADFATEVDNFWVERGFEID